MENNDRYEALMRLKGLLDEGILNQEEYNKEKAKILSRRTSLHTNIHDTQEDNSVSPQNTKKKRSALWVVLGVIAAIVYIQLGNLNDGEGVVGYLNPYEDIDNYLSYSDTYYREGNRVYYYFNLDYSTQDIVMAEILRNLGALLSPAGEVVSGVASVLLETYREQLINELIKKDTDLFKLIAKKGLSFNYMWAGKELFVYSPEEIKKKVLPYL